MLRVESRLLGWHPDLPDHRDYPAHHNVVTAVVGRLGKARRKSKDLPARVDWRDYCGPVEDQQEFGTSAAHACVALIQQFERRATGRLLRLSRLFVHQAARRQQNLPSEADISLRTALKVIVRCGVPPERHWPYQGSNLTSEPDAFAYSFQRGFRALRYVRLDSREASVEEVLDRLRSFLAAGFPFVFGFPVCSAVSNDAELPLPVTSDAIVGGQAVTAVGYDDSRRIRSEKGALLVRNSWGEGWGDGGFGWLPYAYVRHRLAVDFWTLVKPSWMRSGEFEFPVAAP